MNPLTAQIGKFAAVGMVATFTHVAVGLALHELAQASPMSANLAAFLCATLVSYIGNWSWTFEKRTPLEKAGPRFFALALFCLCLSQGIVFIISDVGGLPYAVALIPIVTVVPVVNFWLSRSKVFVDVSDQS